MSNAKEELLKKLEEFKGNLGMTESLILDALKKKGTFDAAVANLTDEEKEKIAEMALELINKFEEMQKN